MGYTHYWNHPEIDATTWAALQVITRKILKVAQDDLGIALSEEYDINRAPIVNDSEIRFNGYAEEGHETFYMSRNASNFSFCKTDRKPYDPVVIALLQAFGVYAGGFSWGSDGDAEEHAAGLALYNRATGAGWDFTNARSKA